MEKSCVIFKSSKDKLIFTGIHSNKIAFIINKRISNRSEIWKNIKKNIYNILYNIHCSDYIIFVEQHDLNLIISMADYYKIKYTI